MAETAAIVQRLKLKKIVPKLEPENFVLRGEAGLSR